METQSHILAVADEEGSLRLLNVQKQATSSLVKGTCTNDWTNVHVQCMYTFETPVAVVICARTCS